MKAVTVYKQVSLRKELSLSAIIEGNSYLTLTVNSKKMDPLVTVTEAPFNATHNVTHSINKAVLATAIFSNMVWPGVKDVRSRIKEDPVSTFNSSAWKELVEPESEGRLLFTPAGEIVPSTLYLHITLSYNATEAWEAIGKQEEWLEEMRNKAPYSQERDWITPVINNALKDIRFRKDQLMDALETYQNRGRRSLSELFSGFGTLISLFTGVTNHKDIETIAENQEQVHHEVTVNRQLLNKLKEEDVKSRKNLLKMTSEASFAAEALALVSRFYSWSDRFEDSIYKAVNGEVSPLICPVEALDQVMHSAREEAQKQQLEVLVDEKLELLKIPKSISVQESGILTTFHVPAIPRESGIKMNLLRLEDRVVARENKTIEVQTDKEFLGITHTGWMASFSAGQLNSCQRFGSTYLCHLSRAVQRQPFDCLTALYQGEREEELCSAETKQHSGNYIVHLGGNKYLGVAPKARMTCPGELGSDMDWDQLEERILPDECAIDGGDFYLTPRQNDQKINGVIRTFKVPEHIHDGFMEEDQDSRESVMLRSREEIHNEELETDKFDDETVIPEVKDLKSIKWSWQTWLLIGLGIAILVLALIIAVLAKCICSKQGQKVISALAEAGAATAAPEVGAAVAVLEAAAHAASTISGESDTTTTNTNTSTDEAAVDGMNNASSSTQVEKPEGGSPGEDDGVSRKSLRGQSRAPQIRAELST